MSRNPVGEALYVAALESCSSGISIADARQPDMPLVFVNRGFEQMTGYPRSEVIGLNCRFLQGDVTGQASVAALRQSLTDGTGGVFHLRNFRKDGTFFWNELHISPLYDDAGQLTHFIGIQHDVTERKEAQEELKRLNLALRLASRAAEEASRAKSAFLANMSHELRTPMNAILGYSDMLIEDLQGTDQDDLVGDLQRINEAGRHLLALINDILDLSKIEAGKMELHPEDTDLVDLVRSAVSTVEPLVAKNRNTISVELPEDVGYAHLDGMRLRQVLINVLGNAAKFTEDGTITVTLQRRRGERETIELAVADTGIGMTPDQVTRLFQDFSQGDRSTTRKYGGTGLGLAISQRFCGMMGGGIYVESRPGEGSVFRIVVPSSAERAATLTPEPVARTQYPKGTGPAVLVVDDDPNVRDLVARLLGREGYEVIGADNGDTGLQLARELKPALVTLDVMMRGTDGWTVLQRLKADPATSAIPVLMLSICDDPQLGVALGAEDFLVKPVRREALLAAVSRAVGDSDRTVLVVDDDPGARDLARRTLEREGWPVVTATNGREALLEIARRPPAAIVLDLMMPEMDGFEVVAALQEEARWRDIPVVIVTAKLLDDEDRAKLRGGVQRILGKDGRPAGDLLREVTNLLQRNQRSALKIPV